MQTTSALKENAIRFHEGSQNYFYLAFTAMGTNCQITFQMSPSRSARDFVKQTLAWVRQFEVKYSRFLATSMISTINRNAGHKWTDIDEDLESMFVLSTFFHGLTGGVFNPAAFPLMQLWDYKTYRGVLPSERDIQETLELVDWNTFQRERRRCFLPHEKMGIDMGGIGKEYAVDQVINMAKDFEIQNIMVDFGHDIRCLGGPPEGGAWRIGLEIPFELNKCWSGVGINDGAIATSGTYIRNFKSEGKVFSHILDPRTGRPVSNDCTSCNVIAQTCVAAGVIAKSMMIMGQDEALPFLEGLFHVEGCLQTRKNRYFSRRFDHYVLSRKI